MIAVDAPVAVLAVAQSAALVLRELPIPLLPDGTIGTAGAGDIEQAMRDAFDRYDGAGVFAEWSEMLGTITGVRVCGTVDALESGTPVRYAIDLRVELRARPIGAEYDYRERNVMRATLALGWGRLGRGGLR